MSNASIVSNAMSSAKGKAKAPAGHKPIILKHKHNGFDAMDCLDTALKIALKERNTCLISKTDSLIIVQKTREVAPFISKMLRLPRTIMYEEKWKLETDAETPRFLITANIDIGRYGLTVGSQFKQSTDAVAQKTLVEIHSKVVVRGLDKDAVMYKLVKNYIRCEFAAQRGREKRSMKRAQRKKAQAKDHGEDAESDQEETTEIAYAAETAALMKKAEALMGQEKSPENSLAAE